jgi:hypothetical protein
MNQADPNAVKLPGADTSMPTSEPSRAERDAYARRFAATDEQELRALIWHDEHGRRLDPITFEPVDE